MPTASATTIGDLRVPSCFDVQDRAHLDAAWAFAVEHGKAESLLHCFDQLERIANNRQGTVLLARDFAPHSFYFEIHVPGEDGPRVVLNGGVIFHGAHDGGGNGGPPTFSVSLTPCDGWSLHT